MKQPAAHEQLFLVVGTGSCRTQTRFGARAANRFTQVGWRSVLRSSEALYLEQQADPFVLSAGHEQQANLEQQVNLDLLSRPF